MSPRFVASCALGCGLMLTSTTFAVSPGQVDDFQDGTTMQWTVGGGPGGGVPPFPPTNADGGPAGGGDLFLSLLSTGSQGAGGKMVVLNGDQWAGDYVGSGISGIAMDVNNQSGLPLDLRLRFEHFAAPGPPSGDFISANVITLAPQSGWQNVFFPISESDLTDLTLGAGDDYVTSLSDVGVVRLMHAPTTVIPPPPIDAVLGVDNITAVPEPDLLWPVAFVAVWWIFRRRSS